MKIIILGFLLHLITSRCIHKQALEGHVISVYTPPESERRLLIETDDGPIRVHIQNVDSPKPPSQLYDLENNIILVAKSFYESFLNVVHVPKIVFPLGTQTCNGLTIPTRYMEGHDNFQGGVEADFGVIYGNTIDSTKDFVASSLPCTQYNGTQTNSMRPIWAAVVFNIPQMSKYFKRQITASEFQTITYVAIHELCHALAFSSSLFQSFPTNGNGFNFQSQTDVYKLYSENLTKVIRNHFNCDDQTIDFLSTQDNNGAGSHWEKYLVGDELMITTTSTDPYISELTISLFETTGWYTKVNRDYIEPTIWGKNKGCDFLKQKTFEQRCNFEEFAAKEKKSFECDFNCIGYGEVREDQSLNCKSVKIADNALCISKDTFNQQILAITAEKPGAYAKCFESNLRKKGKNAIRFNNRCYPAACFTGGKYIGIQIEGKFHMCLFPSQTLQNIPGFDGTITCPQNFDQICKNKRTCPINCGTTGTCINGKCLCAGQTGLQKYCKKPQEIQKQKDEASPTRRMLRVQEMMKCPSGMIFDPINKECQSCQQILGCRKCNSLGCTECNDGSVPNEGRCK